MGNKMTEGAAIDVVSPGGAVTILKGELYRVNKWNGFAMSTVLPTDPELGFALQVSQDIWWISIPAGVAAAAGDVLWWSAVEGFKAGPTDLVIAGTASAIGPACKVVVAKDANNIAAVRPLNIA